MGKFWALSGLGMNTKVPYVSLRHEDFILQVSPKEAREIASNILQCAEAAEQDQFLFEWVKQAIKVNDQAAAVILKEYRDFREAQERKPDEEAR